MAKQLPPAFTGIDFSSWNTWPDVVIQGIPYKQIPGRPQYLFNPYSGAYGEIVANGDQIAKDAGYEEPKEPGILEDLAPAAGLLGGLYLVNKGGGILDAGKEALLGEGKSQVADVAANQVTGGSQGVSGIFGNMFGGSGGTEVMGPPVPSIENGGLMGPPEGVAPMGSTVIPLAAAAYGGYQLFKMATGKKRNMAEKLSMALPTAGLSMLPFEHESTRDVARRHTRDLQGQAEDDAQWQNYVGGMRQQFDSAPTNDKPFSNSKGERYGSFSEYRDAGLDPDNLTGVYGNLETYGPEWAHLTYDQQRAITQANINDDNYYSKKGEVRIRDQDKAQARKNEILANGLAPTPPKPQQPQTMGASIANTAAPAAASQQQQMLPVGAAAQQQQMQQAPTPLRPVFQLDEKNIKRK